MRAAKSNVFVGPPRILIWCGFPRIAARRACKRRASVHTGGVTSGQIKVVRMRLKLTQAEFARALGISLRALVYYEHGRAPRPIVVNAIRRAAEFAPPKRAA